MDKFLSDLANSDAFRLGTVLGIAGLAIGWLTALLRPKHPQPPIGGALYSAAVLIVLFVEFDVKLAVIAGCVVMVAGVMLGTEIWERALGALPGAAMVVYLGEAGSRAAGVVVVLAIAIGAALVVDFDRSFRRTGIALPLLAGSVFGVLVTVPDTERAFALVAVALPLIFLGWPRPVASLGPGVAAAIGAIGWVSGLAGQARPGAAIGALAALGLMLGEPIGRRIAGSRPSALLRLAGAGPLRSLIIVAVHGVLVFGATRIAGLQHGALAAIALSAPFLIVGALLGAAPDTTSLAKDVARAPE
jgi:hypothetical protein